MQLHKLHNVDHIVVHLTRSYHPKHQNFNGTCILEGFLCRKARKKIVKKNWKQRWFRLFAVGDNYSVLVYVAVMLVVLVAVVITTMHTDAVDGNLPGGTLAVRGRH